MSYIFCHTNLVISAQKIKKNQFCQKKDKSVVPIPVNCWRIHLNCSYLQSEIEHDMNAFHHISLLLLCPALLPVLALSCSRSGEIPALADTTSFTEFHFESKAGSAPSVGFPSRVEIFVFNDDERLLLDSYQRMETEGILKSVNVHSTAGRKRLVVIAGAEADRFSHNDVLSYKSLCAQMQDIRKDNPGRPVLCCEASFIAGKDTEPLRLELKPLLSQVRISSLKVDFSERPYRDRTLDGLKAYLINVNGMCRYVEGGAVSVCDILCHAGFDRSSCTGMACPDMFYTESPDGASLYCYPCGKGMYEGCTTRLVIEGTLDGITYYYPIDVGNGSVKSGVCYDYDITLTRVGMSDPDVPAVTGMALVRCTVDDWNENDERIEEF